MQEIFKQALEFLTGTLKAERGIVVYKGQGMVHSINPELVWVAGEISTGLLQELLLEGDPMVMIDAVQDERTRDQTSAILSALRSVLFVPIRDHTGAMMGLLYADHRNRAGAFTNEQLKEALKFVEDVLSPQLLGAASGPGRPLDWEQLTETKFLSSPT